MDLNNLVVSSRVRLARNLESVPFKTKVIGAFEPIANTIKAKNQGFVSTYVSQLKPEIANALFEQHLISSELLANKKNSMIVARNDNKIVVMLGEEDHIRIQSIQTGFDLDNAYTLTKKIADDIESSHKIATRKDFGYLTSCPTNLGSGMRASVMLFLPALTMKGEIEYIAEQLCNEHLTVRGVYGEGSAAGGYMYQISNQACVGMSSKKILDMVKDITMQIVKYETEIQAQIFKESPDEIIDNVMRAYGLLTNAYMISSQEAVENLAVLKLGSNLGIIKFKNQRILDDMFFIIQPQTLVATDYNAKAIIERDKIRAKRVRELLKSARL
jgi:protein arginine kinase